MFVGTDTALAPLRYAIGESVPSLVFFDRYLGKKRRGVVFQFTHLKSEYKHVFAVLETVPAFHFMSVPWNARLFEQHSVCVFGGRFVLFTNLGHGAFDVAQ